MIIKPGDLPKIRNTFNRKEDDKMKVFKKIFVLLILLVGLTGLIGCQNTNIPGSDNNDPEPGTKEFIIKSIDNYLDTILNKRKHEYLKVEEEKLVYNHEYVAAINLLSKTNYDIKRTDILSKEIVETYINNETEITSAGEAFKTMVIAKAYDIEIPTTVIEYVKNLEGPLALWDYSNAAHVLRETKNNATLEQAIKDAIPTIDKEEYFDADTAAMIIAAINNYNLDIKHILNVIKSKTVSGGVLGWDDEVSSMSTSVVMIGLLANGMDITVKDKDENDVNLYDQLLKFIDMREAAFKNKLTDAEVSNDMATPQAFAALAVYRAYLLSNKKVDLFH